MKYFDDVSGTYFFILSGWQGNEMLGYGRRYEGEYRTWDFDILIADDFPFEGDQLRYYSHPDNYFAAPDHEVETRCSCCPYRDSIAGAYSGWYTEKEFTGVSNSVPQFDTTVHNFVTVNFTTVSIDDFVDSKGCLYTADMFYSDTLYIWRGPIVSSSWEEHDWQARMRSDEIQEYPMGEITNTSDDQFFEFSKNAYYRDEDDAGSYNYVQFKGEKQ